MDEQTLAAGSNRRFHHTEGTTASAQAIWDRWCDPETWALWDQGLRQAQLLTGFEIGGTGSLTPAKGPSSKFVIEAIDPGTSYTFATAMPGATLRVRRELLSEPPTTFRHTVWFEGPMAWLFSRLYGKQFRAALPPTMRALAELAESDAG